MISHQTRLSVCQLLDLLTGERAYLGTLIEKHFLDGEINWYDRDPLVVVRRVILESDEERLLTFLRELARTKNETRQRVAPRYRFDERMTELERCLALDGYHIQDAELVAGDHGTSDQDDLLPLLRRRVFDADLVRYVREAAPERPVALVMLDLDKFKAVNDSHGHPVGDELLIEVARCATDVIGSKGRAYRYGGEEIAVLLPNYSPDEALALAERLRRALETGTWTSKQLKVTGSFGVAAASTLASDPADLLRLADIALYDAKDLGRNYVRLAGEPRPVSRQPRRADRREPEPGGMSEAQMEELRLQYYKLGDALCPRDAVPLRVQETTGFGFKSPGLHMACLACGFEVEIPGIPVANSEG